jgi:protoporphyrinogen oxidase
MNKKVAVIGGGISGLCSAYYLSKGGCKVSVFEKNGQLGGLLETVQVGETRIEKFYHHFFKQDKELIALISELGLSKKINWIESSISLHKRFFYDFNNAFDLLRYPHLTPMTKIRFAIGSIFIRKMSYKKTNQFTAEELICRFMGKEAWTEFWQYLFEGKFGEYADKISGSWIKARIEQRAKGALFKKEKLGYLDGSFSVLVRTLEKKARNSGSEFFLEKNIEEIKQFEGKYLVGNESFDYIVDTRPCLNSKIKKTNYLGAVTMLVHSNMQFTQYYWSNIFDQKPFIGMIEHTNFISADRFDKQHIIYLVKYVSAESEEFKQSDEEISKIWLKELVKLLPHLKSAKIKAEVFKYPFAQPIVEKNYCTPKHLLKKNYYHTSMAHIFPADRGMNEAVKEARLVCDLIKNEEN